MPDPEPASSPDLDRLRRWVAHGGAWELAADTGDRVSVRLLTCDGGEEMERLDSADPALVAAVRAETEDQDDNGRSGGR